MALSKWFLFSFFISLSLCDYTNVRNMVSIVGPRTVDANGMDYFNHDNPEWLETLENAVGMIGFSSRLVADDNSTTLGQQDLYLHHLVINSLQDRNIACPEYGHFNFVAGSGAEFTDIILQYPYANKLDPKEQLSFDFDVINPSSTNPITYYIEYTFTIVDWTNDIVEVEGYFNSVTGCEGNSYLIFDVDKSNVSAYNNAFLDFESTFTGQFVYLTGHLHAGGKNIYLANRDSGEIIVSSNAHYEDPVHPGFLTSIEYTNDLAYKAKMHDKHRIASVYDATESYAAVMAIVFGYAIVEELYAGPEPLAQYFGYGNPFALPLPSQLVGAPSPVNPAPVDPGEKVDETSGSINFTILITVTVLGFVVAAVLLALIVAAMLAVVKYKAKRYSEVYE